MRKVLIQTIGNFLEVNVKPNETLEECLHREWKEELNLQIKIEKLLHVSKNQDIECYFYTGRILDMGNLHVNVHQYVSFYDIEHLNQIRLFENDKDLIPLLKKLILNINDLIKEFNNT